MPKLQPIVRNIRILRINPTRTRPIPPSQRPRLIQRNLNSRTERTNVSSKTTSTLATRILIRLVGTRQQIRVRIINNRKQSTRVPISRTNLIEPRNQLVHDLDNLVLVIQGSPLGVVRQLIQLEHIRRSRRTRVNSKRVHIRPLERVDLGEPRTPHSATLDEPTVSPACPTIPTPPILATAICTSH